MKLDEQTIESLLKQLFQLGQYDYARAKLKEFDFVFKPGDSSQSKLVLQDELYWSEIYSRNRD